MYGVERLEIVRATFTNLVGPAVELVRSGRDESTFGPALIVAHTQFDNVGGAAGVLRLTGVQRIDARDNTRINSQKGSLTVEVGLPTLEGSALDLIDIVDLRPSQAVRPAS